MVSNEEFAQTRQAASIARSGYSQTMAALFASSESTETSWGLVTTLRAEEDEGE
jgi:hypothetical protein